MKKFAYACAAATILAAGPALATENGTQNYPIGVNTVADGYLPPPGMLQYLDYFQEADSPASKNGSGNAASHGFNLTATANASRFLYTWGPEIGPFHYTTGLVVPVVYLDLHVAGMHGHDFGTGNIDIQNYLGAHSQDKKLFYFFGLDTYIPTGNYKYENLISTGANYTTFAPNVDVSYNPTPQWELTGVFFSEFNTVNQTDHYHSGDDLDVDFGTTYRPFKTSPQWGFGLQGYFYKQITDDTVRGVSVAPDGYRGQEFAIGPQIRYDIPFGGFVLKYQHEYAVRNRPAGEKIWLQFAAPIFGGPKS
jgi:hypothetical protein